MKTCFWPTMPTHKTQFYRSAKKLLPSSIWEDRIQARFTNDHWHLKSLCVTLCHHFPSLCHYSSPSYEWKYCELIVFGEDIFSCLFHICQQTEAGSFVWKDEERPSCSSACCFSPTFLRGKPTAEEESKIKMRETEKKGKRRKKSI